MKKLFKNISYLYTFQDKKYLQNAYIVVLDNIIDKIGTGSYEGNADQIIDCKDYLVLPGFINIHHHFYQTLFRNVKKVQSSKLFNWLTYLYEKWKHIDEEAVYISTKIAIFEMMKSGVTTSTDHLYLFPRGNNKLFDIEVEAAKEAGIRFYPTRGSMSLSKKDGGLPPDSVVQTDTEIMQESERVVNQYHDPSLHSMLRVGLAPCSPFSVTDEIMRQTADFSCKHDIMIHTHLAETKDEEEFCLEKVGLRPVDYLDELGWLNERSWLVHLVWLNDYDRKKLIRNDCGMAHCPSSNMRLGSGIAPVALLKNKMRIGLGLDGSASNDTNNMFSEIRRALLLQRVKYGANAITPYEALKFATVGSAQVLNIDEYTGMLATGMSADFIGLNLNRLEFAGGLSDPLGALVLCDAKQVDLSVINGSIKIKNGQLQIDNLTELVKQQNKKAAELLEKN